MMSIAVDCNQCPWQDRAQTASCETELVCRNTSTATIRWLR